MFVAHFTKQAYSFGMAQTSFNQDAASDRAIVRVVMGLAFAVCVFIGVLLVLGVAGVLEPTCASAPAGLHVGVCREFTQPVIENEMIGGGVIPVPTLELK